MDEEPRFHLGIYLRWDQMDKKAQILYLIVSQEHILVNSACLYVFVVCYFFYLFMFFLFYLLNSVLHCLLLSCFTGLSLKTCQSVVLFTGLSLKILWPCSFIICL